MGVLLSENAMGIPYTRGGPSRRVTPDLEGINAQTPSAQASPTKGEGGEGSKRNSG